MRLGRDPGQQVGHQEHDQGVHGVHGAREEHQQAPYPGGRLSATPMRPGEGRHWREPAGSFGSDGGRQRDLTPVVAGTLAPLAATTATAAATTAAAAGSTATTQVEAADADGDADEGGFVTGGRGVGVDDQGAAAVGATA